MKVIFNTFTDKKEEDEIICTHCKSVLRVSEEDFNIGEYGASYIVCPCCKEKIESDNFPFINLTKDNVKFPKHYHCTKNSAKQLEDYEVDDKVRYCIDFLQKYPKEPYRYFATGDSFIIVFNHTDEEDYYVMVAKDYFDTFVEK